jgi:hypothetical protein
MSIELPPQIESAIKVRSEARGVSASDYLRELLERDLAADTPSGTTLPPFETGYGMWSKYGVNVSEKDIDENRSEIFKNFGEGF